MLLLILSYSSATLYLYIITFDEADVHMDAESQILN
nr:MAG TPA: hypothetical protein [Caudoviricetes sp.]DAY32447.1 MAG TPA: hypothetical protein [Caudoviricetes sp.]